LAIEPTTVGASTDIGGPATAPVFAFNNAVAGIGLIAAWPWRFAERTAGRPSLPSPRPRPVGWSWSPPVHNSGNQPGHTATRLGQPDLNSSASCE
jgi:hypothetical protein